jgi:hypothetical protein
MTDTTENPWETAASDAEWSNQANLNFSLEEQPALEEEEFASKLVRYVVNTWHACDAVVGLAMCIYGAILWQAMKHQAVVMIVGGVLLMVQSIAGTYSVYRDALFRLGLLFSAYLSILFIPVLFFLSMVSLGMRHKLASFWADHQHDLHLSDKMVNFLKTHEHSPWILLLVLCVIEGLRWISLANYRQYLLEDDELALQLVPQSPRRMKRPWWWKSTKPQDDGLGDPLLGPSWVTGNSRSFQMEDGIDRNATSTTVWKRLFGKTQSSSHNVRDDGSVDFASVQEEWASRSEQDPLWWAREEQKES